MKNLTLIFIALAFLVSCQSKFKEPIVVISTKYGDIQIKLYEKTPKHRENFLKLVNENYFDSTTFHRVIQNFMIQGGDPDSKHAKPGVLLGNGGPDYTIPFEYVPEYIHKRGVLAAGRENDDVNPQMASSASQFYIVQGKKFTDAGLDTLYKKINRQHKNAQNWKLTPHQREVYKTIGGTPHLDGFYTVFGEVISGMEVVDKIAALKTDSNNRPLQDVRMTVKLR